ncbi:hypothetical protein AGMMS50218_15920 [Actinomycetota bacterium]|nr:hypothetical protein AGMMS50218_15920 [Actinomycetota bacterium]
MRDDQPPASDVTAGPEVTVLRQPVVNSDRTVYGYAVRVHVQGPDGRPLPLPQAERLVDAELTQLDLAAVGGDRLVLLQATTGVLTGQVQLGPTPFGLVLEVPPHVTQRPDAVDLLLAASQHGIRLALADYTGSATQDALLPYVSLTKVDLARGPDRTAELISRAHAAGASVIAERADDRDRVRLAIDLGTDLLQGPMFARRPETTGREFSAGELQCLELVQLLGADPVDQGAVVRTVGSDPELAIRVLHLVNSSAYGLRRAVDSVAQAVVLVGPQQLSALAMASLIDARPTTVGALWSILTRATTCRALTGDDAAYTVGLLSAVAAQQGFGVDDLVSRAGVSEHIARALRDQTGPYGPVLAAVLAHEENDPDGVRLAGLEPYDVAHAYLAALPEALGIATALAVSSGASTAAGA